MELLPRHATNRGDKDLTSSGFWPSFMPWFFNPWCTRIVTLYNKHFPKEALRLTRRHALELHLKRLPIPPLLYLSNDLLISYHAILIILTTYPQLTDIWNKANRTTSATGK